MNANNVITTILDLVIAILNRQERHKKITAHRSNEERLFFLLLNGNTE